MPRPNATIVSPRMTDSLRRSHFYPHVVDIQRGASSRSPSGANITGGYVTLYANVPARVQPTTGGEMRRPDGTLNVDAETIELAGSYSEIKSTDRVWWNGQAFNILRVDHAPADDRARLIVERVH